LLLLILYSYYITAGTLVPRSVNGDIAILLGLVCVCVCVLLFICLLFPNHTNLNYLNGWGLYGEFRYKCKPTRWLRITRKQV